MSTNARPAVPINPRIRERRLAVQRDEGRRRLRIAIACTTVVVVIAAAYAAVRSPLLDVDHVTLHGASHTTLADVIEAAGFDERPPIATLDEARAAARIERLPWVDSARVSRSWPGTVEVTLLERTPVAVAHGPGEQWSVLDPTGRVLAHEATLPPGLTLVEMPKPTGPPATTVGPVARAALTIVESLPEPLAGRVPRIRIWEDDTLDLVLDDKVPVRFGPPTQVRPKLVALTTLIQKADLARVTAVDVRAPTAPVLTRR